MSANIDDPLASVERLFDEVGFTTYGDSMNVYHARRAVRLLIDHARPGVTEAIRYGEDMTTSDDADLISFARSIDRDR